MNLYNISEQCYSFEKFRFSHSSVNMFHPVMKWYLIMKRFMTMYITFTYSVSDIVNPQQNQKFEKHISFIALTNN